MMAPPQYDVGTMYVQKYNHRVFPSRSITRKFLPSTNKGKPCAKSQARGFFLKTWIGDADSAPLPGLESNFSSAPPIFFLQKTANVQA